MNTDTPRTDKLMNCEWPSGDPALGEDRALELCRQLERENASMQLAIHEMLPIVQAVAGKGPLSDPQWNLKAFAEDVLAIYFPNAQGDL
jgi:hypothetical protein